MLVLTRFRGDVGDLALAARLEEALQLLSAQRGYVRGAVGRNVDDPTLWVLQTEWEGPGAYRRALSSYEVKMNAWALLGQAIDEPSAYEVLDGTDEANTAVPRRSR